MKARLKIFLLLGLLLSGCGKKDVSHSSTEQKKDTVTAKEIERVQKEPGNQKNDTDSSRGQITGLTYDVNSIPDDIKYQGKIFAGARWDDKNGSNILLLTETAEKRFNKDENGDTWREKELFGYHFIDRETSAELLWKINDFVKDCPVDITLEFINGSLTVTDLNRDGFAETTFLYKMSCRGDVSPNTLKLMMHEGDKKYAIRGTTKIEIKGEKPYGGETNIDVSFNSAPEGFLNYAKEQWKKYQVERY